MGNFVAVEPKDAVVRSAVNGFGSNTAGLPALILILNMDIEGPPYVLCKVTQMGNEKRPD